MLIEEIKSPDFIRDLSAGELRELAYEIRKFLIKSVSKTGGHLASNLGVVELTLALHSVFDLKKDKLVWDVGHQSYVHKILTGRAGDFATLRQFGGISGFPKTAESDYDAFNTGHSSTSASAALGLARARDLSDSDHQVISVFGDGALTGGMIFEALNDAGHSKSKTIFILNDNEMSISQNVGGMSKYLQKLRYNPEYYKSKDAIEEFLQNLPVGADAATSVAKRMKNTFRTKVLPNTLFDNLGLKYVGPIDGHNIEALKAVLDRAKHSDKSYFIHIYTKKGKGYAPAEQNPQLYHGISAGNPSGAQADDYSAIFGKTLCDLASENEKIVAITGAMPLGTGLSEYLKKFPDRYFDVGICEEHAVTMAAGLAMGGLIPVVPLYSTFMQRAYDQIMHDVCIQNLHVVLCADRAGIVGQDGETHQGMFDIAYLSHLPNMTILSPSSFDELSDMMDYAINVHQGPIAIRYPRGNTQSAYTEKFTPGKIRTEKVGSDLLIISTGRMMKTASEVAEKIGATLVNMPTIFPIDSDAICEIAKGKKLVVTIEDGVKVGGMGQMIAMTLLENDVTVPFLTCAFPNEPITHGNCAQLDKLYEMDTDSIIKRIEDKLNG